MSQENNNDFGSAHHLVHRRSPLEWQDGFPLGNGTLGAMVWGDGDPLAFTLDRADLWDTRLNGDFMDQPGYSYAGLRRLVAEGRFDEAREVFEGQQERDNPVAPTKISIGRAELSLGAAEEYECCLDIDRAVITGRIRTGKGEYRLQIFISRDRNLFCLHLAGAPVESRLRLIPLAEMCPALAELHHPEPQFCTEGELRVLRQEIPAGRCYAVAWNTTGPDFFMAVEAGTTVESAANRAKSTWEQAAAAGCERLYTEHERGWKGFWQFSSVCLPEARMEFLWYYGIYLLASSAKRGVPPPGLQGLWAMDGVMPPWRGDYHADMNVQETFWPACASGHLELLDAWCDYMQVCIEPAREFTRRFFGTEGTFWPCSTVPDFTLVNCWYTVQYSWSHTGWLGWLVWLRWVYSMDREWLAATGYPLMAEIFRFFAANLEEEEDGFLHVPLSTSPEYRENSPEAWCKDPNVDLALIRRCCDWVVEMEAALGTGELSGAAKRVHKRLVPYFLTAAKELCLWPGKLLDESHRHPSHLMAIHPAMDLTSDDGEEAREIIAASVEQFFALGQYRWAGHTYAQLISFAAVLGRAGWAYDCLLQFAERWAGPNGLHCNADLRDSGMSTYRRDRYGDGSPPFTMEANCAISAGISDMLVQGWEGILRIFPAMPERWQDAAFGDLVTEGAFRVSAIRRAGQTVWVRVMAGVDSSLQLRDPFAGEPYTASRCEVRRETDLIICDLKKGQVLVVQLDGITVDLAEISAQVRQSDVSLLGLR
ncbi:MAG: hypothetical protein HOC74_32230 [Gemmatimonadetes bacterium]|nr:hypothetical protein [Gemmatimonadota bacterium]